MFQLVIWLVGRIMPSNDVGVLRIGYAVRVNRQLLRKYRCSVTDTATNCWRGRMNVKIGGRDSPNLCLG